MTSASRMFIKSTHCILPGREPGRDNGRSSLRTFQKIILKLSTHADITERSITRDIIMKPVELVTPL